jgi:hypothetical protein
MSTTEKCPYANENSDHQEKSPVKIRFSLFFDGTLNNRTNTLSRQKKSEDYEDLSSSIFDSCDSYENDFTNIALLEWQLATKQKGYEKFKALYIEGIGTENNEADSVVIAGASRGKGDTGIETKVEKALKQVYLYIIKNIENDRAITIHLDSFGFSRGGAAARHFIHKAIIHRQYYLRGKLKKAGYEVKSIRVRFVGLFDTVASFGVNHSNDTKELNLDAIKLAEKVIQLAAAEEHRKNFRLTNINSALKQGIGDQYFLPGVHSDVGGGYRDNYKENSLQLFDIDSIGWNSEEKKEAIRRERKWLIEQGWYTTDELEETNFWNEVIGNRKSIRNTYSRIPLHLMAKFANEETGLEFSKNLNKKYPVPDDLKEVETKIINYIANVEQSKPSDWFNKVNPILKKLRHDFLHFSAFYGSVSNKPQFSNNNPINGRRKRIIQNG